MHSRPNILYLHSHDTGRYVQPYGYAVPTPHIQRFAEQAVVFRQAFSVAPTCSPSRAGLLTGQYPHCCGVHGLTNHPWSYSLDDPAKTLMSTLARAGYRTVLAGVQHITLRDPARLREVGFGEFLNEDNLGEDVPDLHERVARYFAGAPPAPWFLSVGFDQTHRDNRQGRAGTGTCFSQPSPYDSEALDSRYCRPPAIHPDVPAIRQDMASFLEGARRLDERVGHVLAALDQSGHAASTLVILTTDHGIAWPGMKGTLTDHGTGVMLIMRGPGGFSGGRVINPMVTHLDLFPTICDVVHHPPPAWLQGRSLVPLVSGAETSLHDAIFAEHGWHEIAEPQRSVRTERFKYIRRYDPKGPKTQNTDESPTKAVLDTYGWFDRHLGDELLFDLYLDPMETCNRIADPALAGVRSELRQTLRSWMERTHDPLLSGQPVQPPGLNGQTASRVTSSA